MVPAQGDDTRERLAFERRSFFLGICSGFAGEDDIMPFLDLPDRVLIIVPSPY